MGRGVGHVPQWRAHSSVISSSSVRDDTCALLRARPTLHFASTLPTHPAHSPAPHPLAQPVPRPSQPLPPFKKACTHSSWLMAGL